MREYETVIVLDATLDEARVDQEIETVGKVIADGGGEVLDVQRWGRRRLAYEIQKKREGIYSLIRYKSESEVLDELDRRFRLNDVLLRHLTVMSRGPSVIPGFDDRDRDDRRHGRDRDDHDDYDSRGGRRGRHDRGDHRDSRGDGRSETSGRGSGGAERTGDAKPAEPATGDAPAKEATAAAPAAVAADTTDSAPAAATDDSATAEEPAAESDEKQ